MRQAQSTPDGRPWSLADSLVPVTFAALAIILSVALVTARDWEAGWRAAARLSAQVAVLPLVVAYGAASLHRFFATDTTARLLRSRRRIGLSFAAVMAVHVACIFALAAVTTKGHVVHVVDSGGAVYVVIALMALTSNAAAQRALGVWWGRLHAVGINAIMLKFAAQLYPRAAGGSAVSTMLLAAIGLALMLRAADFARGNTRRIGVFAKRERNDA